jgi:hypothetical protein
MTNCFLLHPHSYPWRITHVFSVLIETTKALYELYEQPTNKEQNSKC